MDTSRKRARIAIYVDAENVAMGPLGYEIEPSWERPAAVIRSIVQFYGREGDIIIRYASAQRQMAAELGFRLLRDGVAVWPHAGGPDAADHMLIDSLSEVPRSCDVVVIVSGDGIFAGPARDLRRIGKRVEVVSTLENLSKNLLHAADSVRDLRQIVSGTPALAGSVHT